MTSTTPQHEFVIGIDAGGTHTRVGCFALDGTRLAAAVGRGGNPSHNDDALENIRGTIAQALESGGLDPAGAVALAAGIAGFERTGSNQSDGDNDRTAALVDAPGLTCPKIVVNDAVIAHRGALSGRPGIVVVAGTGSMILAIDEEGVETESGQLEHYAGAARHLVYDVVQQILMNDCSPTDPLVPAALEHFGVADVPSLHEAVLARSSTHRNTIKRSYGDFAPQVTAMGEQSALADRALTDLAARTARGVRLLAPVAGPRPVPVACTGSLADAPSFRDRLDRMLVEAEPSALDLVPSQLDPLGGAAILALEAAGVEVDEATIGQLTERTPSAIPA
ncbi:MULTISPECIES: N-acetylglucosamine kinase [unclassified Brachybacterium]|uniref:N-acetylglucosamine kinase n=1 Tax=unclassified Brachybacterium TaxID=2623841 RepID=UPI0040343B67